MKIVVRSVLAGVTALALAAAAVADGHNRPTPMSFVCNSHGAKVTVRGGPVFYLGNACDAALVGGGTGKWWYAAAAFLVEIDGKMWRFANEIKCPIRFCNYTGN